MRVRCSERGQDAKSYFLWLKWSWCWPGSGIGEHSERKYSFMVKSTGFWIWITLGFNSGSATSCGTLGEFLHSYRPNHEIRLI